MERSVPWNKYIVSGNVDVSAENILKIYDMLTLTMLESQLHNSKQFHAERFLAKVTYSIHAAIAWISLIFFFQKFLK